MVASECEVGKAKITYVVEESNCLSARTRFKVKQNIEKDL